jgi:hypothetical protein
VEAAAAAPATEAAPSETTAAEAAPAAVDTPVVEASEAVPAVTEVPAAAEAAESAETTEVTPAAAEATDSAVVDKALDEIISKMSEVKVANFKKMFDLLDKDHDGVITPLEFGAVMRALGQVPTDADIMVGQSSDLCRPLICPGSDQDV